MNIKYRIGKLEAKANSDFRVAYPVRLDENGQRLTAHQDDSDCVAVAFRCAGDEVVVQREPGEDVRELKKRAGKAAALRFEGAIFLAIEPGY